MRWFLLGLALLLGGCGGGSSHADLDDASLNSFPNNYQAQLLSFLRTGLNDPKFQDALISEPALKPVSGAVSRYVVCVRFTDKSGVSIRNNDKLAVFFHGDVNQLIDANPDQCGSVTYKPLVEPASASAH